jgi:hypothetical protein
MAQNPRNPAQGAQRAPFEIADGLGSRSTSNSGWALAHLIGASVAGGATYFMVDQLRRGDTYSMAEFANSKIGSGLGLDQTSLATNPTDLLALTAAVAALATLYFAFNLQADLRNSAAADSGFRKQAEVLGAATLTP